MKSTITENKTHTSPYRIKLEAAQRFLMWHLLSVKLDLIHVTEFPKSGGSWVSQMVADYLDLPFPRNQRPALTRCVMQGHHLYSRRFNKVLCVFRDGRDTMISAYYYFLFHTDRSRPWAVERARSRMPFNDYDNITKNMATFIEFMFTDWAKAFGRFTWSEFVRSWHDKSVASVKYEELLVAPRQEMAAAITRLSGQSVDSVRLTDTINRYSFENQTGRTRGTEDRASFIRKGVSGEWREKFDLRAGRAFAHYAGEELVLLGYAQTKDYRKW